MVIRVLPLRWRLAPSLTLSLLGTTGTRDPQGVIRLQNVWDRHPPFDPTFSRPKDHPVYTKKLNSSPKLRKSPSIHKSERTTTNMLWVTHRTGLTIKDVFCNTWNNEEYIYLLCIHQYWRVHLFTPVSPITPHCSPYISHIPNITILGNIALNSLFMIP